MIAHVLQSLWFLFPSCDFEAVNPSVAQDVLELTGFEEPFLSFPRAGVTGAKPPHPTPPPPFLGDGLL